MSGMEILLKQVMKSLGLNAEIITDTASTIGRNVVEAKAQLDRIEANQKLIMDKLEIGQSAEIVYLPNPIVRKEATNE